MTEEWLERQEGPNGQYCDLLTRLPYERQRMIEALPPTSRPADIKDVVLRALLWDAKVNDTLTGQPTAVSLSFDGATQTFDVLLAGAPTACTHLPTKAQGPVAGFRVTDETIEGYGRHVDFTSFTLASP